MKKFLILMIFLLLLGCKKYYKTQYYITEVYQKGIKIDEICSTIQGAYDSVYYKRTDKKCD
jgi:hypothetical protein